MVRSDSIKLETSSDHLYYLLALDEAHWTISHKSARLLRTVDEGAGCIHMSYLVKTLSPSRNEDQHQM